MKKMLLFFTLMFGLIDASAQTIHFPDSVFKAILIKKGIDANHNNEIEISEAQTVTNLSLSYSDVTNLAGLEYFTELLLFQCNWTDIVGLDVTKNKKLTWLECATTNLTHLDLSQNVNLSRLSCYNNQLASLDVSKNVNLTVLSVGANSLTALDVSKNTKIRQLYVYKNKLLTLDIRNLDQLEYFYYNENPYLSDICVTPLQLTNTDNWIRDEEAVLRIDCGLSNSQLIPDPSFRQALIGMGLDENNNGEIEPSEIEDVDSLSLSNLNIVSLSGIEYFPNLTYLDCSMNHLGQLDLRANLQLTYLNCALNSISSLSLSTITKLKYLACYSNNLSQLKVNNSPTLLNLYCGDNKITSLDLRTCKQLKRLSCHSNELATIDLSVNTVLEYVAITYNRLTLLNLDKNVRLKTLYCASNSLATLDLNQNTLLNSLDCSNNKLSNLHINQIAHLSVVSCRANDLTQICISQEQIPLCVKWLKDDHAEWFICGSGRTSEEISDREDGNMESVLVYPNPAKGVLHISSQKEVHNVAIKNLEGTTLLVSKAKIVALAPLTKGMYVVVIETEAGTETQKIVVE